MTSLLFPPIALTDVDPSTTLEFFSLAQVVAIDMIGKARECSDIGIMPPKCAVNLAFGFFFDGTNNNLPRDFPTRNQSNVAKLYLAFPGSDGEQKWPSAKTIYPHHFHTYIPGVGTRFGPVGDTGEGEMKKDGLAFAKPGQNRIIWALVASAQVQRAFRISLKLIEIFNAFVVACGENGGAKRTTPLHEIMAKQHQLYIQWRKK